jgi:hypothetical protein
VILKELCYIVTMSAVWSVDVVSDSKGVMLYSYHVSCLVC